MNVQISATGTPDQVMVDVGKQLKVAAGGTEGSWPTIASLRDYIAKQVAAGPGGKSVTVTVALAVTIGPDVEAAKPKARAHGK